MQQDEVRVLLTNLEHEIVRLRIEYNKSLAGLEDANREFAEQRVQALIKALNKTHFKKYIYKFKFENLTARVNVMKINFGRMMKDRDKKLDSVKKKLGLKSTSQPASQPKTKEVNTLVVNDLNASGKSGLKSFFHEYTSLSEANNKQVKLNFSQFARKIEKRVDKIKAEGTGKGLQLRIVQENGEIKIKTKAVK